MKFSSTALLSIYGVISLAGHNANAAPEAFVTESSSSFNEPTDNLGVNHNRLVVSMKDGIASRTPAMRGAKVGQRFADGELEVVEFDKDTDRLEFLAQANTAGLIVEEDPPIYPYGAQIDYNVSRNLQEQIPWGINDVFTRSDGTVDIPGPDYYPSETRHVCIIDSGYQDSHPDLVTTASNADPSQGSSYKEDGCKHGTHVAGTILATDNNVGVIGVFPGASAFIVKVFGYSGSTSCGWSYSSSLVAAAHHCRDKGADIISMSLGGSYSTNFERQAFETLNDVNGILSIAAAGNGGNGGFSYPASYDTIMSVGATDINKNIASFSQHNSQVDISGPGVSVRSTVGTNGYSSYSGTSMATPHVSGVALLLWNKYPTCTNNEIREALEGSALDKGATGKDIYFGHGIVRYWDAVDFLENKPCGTTDTPPTPSPVNAPISPPTLAPITTTAPTGPSTIFPSLAPTSNSTSNSTTTWDEVFFNDFEVPNKFGDFAKGGNMAGRHGKGVHSFSGKGALFIRHGLGKRSALISRPFDVSDYNEVKVDFMFKAVGTENGEGFSLEYSVDGGVEYYTEKTWRNGEDFSNGEYYAVVENIAVKPSFEKMRIRFIALGNQKNDRIFIDDVSVLGALDGEGGGGGDEDVM